MTLRDLLQHRRAVRRYAGTPIDPDTVRECLRACPACAQQL